MFFADRVRGHPRPEPGPPAAARRERTDHPQQALKGKTESCVNMAVRVSNYQKPNSVLECECCRCELPISMQKIFFTAISLDAHNDNIQNVAQSSASEHKL